MKRCCLIILLVFGVFTATDAQTKKKTSKSKTNTTKTVTKQPEEKKKVQEIKKPVTILPQEELERQRKEALQEIELTSQLLTETEANAANSLNRLNLLTQQLTARKRIVVLLEQEVVAIDMKVKSINNEIEDLEKDLKKIRDNYARSMQNQLQEHRTTQYK
ncbi:MAG: hypothetical protein LBT24_01425, partial [Tannerella sp.]|nr:hypothetical protein [Tannerella sp.]